MNPALLTKKEKDLYEEARAMIETGTSAVAFSQRFFGPQGRLREMWRTEVERRAVAGSELFRWLQERMTELRRKEARAFEQEAEAASGRLTIVVPKSLHAALKREAAIEGISLSELIRLKLGVAYRSAVGLLAPGEPHAGTGRASSQKAGVGR